MKSFRNHNKRGRFRNNDRGYKRNGESPRLVNDFSVHSGFRRNTQGRNNYNAAKLIGKYTGLAREALSSGDKILSENYFQHADHFMRIIEDKNKNRNLNNKTNVIDKPIVEEKDFSNNIDANQKQVSKEQDKK